ACGGGEPLPNLDDVGNRVGNVGGGDGEVAEPEGRPVAVYVRNELHVDMERGPKIQLYGYLQPDSHAQLGTLPIESGGEVLYGEISEDDRMLVFLDQDVRWNDAVTGEQVVCMLYPGERQPDLGEGVQMDWESGHGVGVVTVNLPEDVT